MKKTHFYKVAAIATAATLALGSLCACGTKSSNNNSTETGDQTTVANPMTEVSEDELVQQTGIDLPAPEGATDVKYFVLENDPDPIAQMDFTLDGQEYSLRACPTSQTTLGMSDLSADPEEVVGFDLEQGNISGLYYEWDQGATQVVNYCDALCNVSKEGAGYIAWIDAVPGILYNLSMTENATMDQLVETANAVFVPMQGES